MNDGMVVVGQVQPVLTQSGRISAFRVDLHHKGLHESRLLTAPDEYVLQNKAATLLAAWEEKWRRNTARAESLQLLSRSKKQAEANKKKAEALTKEATSAIEQARHLLADGLKRSGRIAWDKWADVGLFNIDLANRFPATVFSDAGEPQHARLTQAPPEPQESDYPPEIPFIARIIPPIRARRLAQARARFEVAHSEWRSEVAAIQRVNQEAEAEFQRARTEFTEARRAFDERRISARKRIEELRAAFDAMEPSAVSEVAQLFLSESKYPSWIERDCVTEYIAETKLLIIEDKMPGVETIPRVSKVGYVASRNELRTSYISDKERDKLYDTVLYQVALRTVYEVFLFDTKGAIQSVVYNGWQTWINKATGVEEKGCLLSLQVPRDILSGIDLSKVDPRACFRQLKGVSAAKLSGMTPIAPIARMNTSDQRFVASHEVASHLDEGVNLASIDWEDFEHLVREVFESEFSAEGGEVKVTRASADGGVDAVVFDPDPIRGGKIVIQAKRYTTTVGVSAVRDLYGTMMNEGAMKGILVTTSDYGPDAYNFASNKPITLLSGGNLLQLMEKHGHQARIDLAEARRLRSAGDA